MADGVRDDLSVAALIEAYTAGESAASLARRFDANIWTILDRLRKANVIIRSRVEQNQRRLDLLPAQAQELRAIVDGLMLGDGSIDPKGLLRLEQAKVRHGWILAVAKRLTALGASSKIIPIPPRTRRMADREIRSSGGHLLYTPAYMELQSERRRWYPKGLKIVPDDVDLSPLAVAYWFCGDGTYDASGRLVFCTNGFSKKAVEQLTRRLTAIGVEARCTSTYSRANEWHVLIARRDAAQALKDLISPFIPRCCQYKLRFVRPTLSSAELSKLRRRLAAENL